MKAIMKTDIYFIALSAIFVIFLQSCVDIITRQEQNVNAMLVFESDINSASGFNAIISTSAGLADVTATSLPTDLDVVVIPITEDVFELFYDEDCVCYRNDVVIPKPGVLYDLKVSSPNNEIYGDIAGRMQFPYVTKSSELKALRQIKSDGSTTLYVRITLEGESTSSNYYHILPYRKITEIVVVDQEEEERYTGEIEYLDLVDFDNNNLYIEVDFYKSGFLVDFNEENISSNTLNLILNTHTVIDYETEAFTKLFFEVRSVTESYYKYEIYQSRKFEGLEAGNVQPPISYGNITNGLGYFGGYNSSTDSISVQ